jgi:hypothetical protein
MESCDSRDFVIYLCILFPGMRSCVGDCMEQTAYILTVLALMFVHLLDGKKATLIAAQDDIGKARGS